MKAITLINKRFPDVRYTVRPDEKLVFPDKESDDYMLANWFVCKLLSIERKETVGPSLNAPEWALIGCTDTGDAIVFMFSHGPDVDREEAYAKVGRCRQSRVDLSAVDRRALLFTMPRTTRPKGAVCIYSINLDPVLV